MDLPLLSSLARIPGPPTPRWPAGARVDVVLERHGLLFELYVPGPVDDQQPHRRDELYIVASGSADFVRDIAGAGAGADQARTAAVAVGDALFVPAGEAHRFDRCSADFATWVVFFGPEHDLDKSRP